MNSKFLFLSVNSSYSHSSLALPVLHSACADVDNWSWESIECTIAEDYADIAYQMAEKSPDLVGASLYIFNRNAVLDILGRFHRLLPQCRIVLGGPECSGDSAAELLKNNPFVKTVFVGESEGIFAEYLKNFPHNDNDSILPAAGAARYDNWNRTLPVNDLFFAEGKAFVQIETSRGCPLKCKYCTSADIPLRFKDLSDVEKELETVQAKGVKEVRLLDRTFNFPQWRGVALLKLFREKFSDIEFHLEIHPHFLDDGIKSELRIAPNLHVEAGVQSLDENVQHAIGRNCCRQDALEGVKFLASCHNFETHVDLICGLPEQDLKSVFDDVADLMNCKVGEIQLETLKILHGTAFRKNADALGLVYAPEPPYDVMQTNNLSGADILYIRKLSRMLDLFYNHNALHRIMLSMPFEDGNAIREFLDFSIANGVAVGKLLDLKKRVCILADYAEKKSLTAVQFEISKAWIENSYPLGALPFGKLEKFSGSLPSGLLCNDEWKKLFAHKETKIWRLVCNGFVYNFALNRHFRVNGSACAWQE